MRRIFRKHHGRFKKGDVRDYPLVTWKSFPRWRSLTAAVVEVPEERAVRQRLVEA